MSGNSASINSWCQEKLLVVSKILMKLQEAISKSKEAPEPKLISLVKDVK